MEKPAKIGYPRPFGSMTNVMQNPKFSTVLGLLLESFRAPKKRSKSRGKAHSKIKSKETNNEHDIFGRFSDSIRSVFKEIF